ncbi:duf953 domain containing protein [Grosmannia clavigera kw1407]|uniref:Duf953 domain containing protein n=1 Tax=Grosmannia clavigera (strain kw1407 / UAMH 11150) TaxID=655863 RepID=F0X6T1_GROCL|nr:duf953 domain containing protein [Grosmannia clavigera kw1407]EFX06600.1 duf953 domain containing protein [Grosmannia clavigera kw1407]
MPLQNSVLSPAALAQQLVKDAKAGSTPAYLVVYAGLINGRSWCGDCRTAEPYLERKFAQKDAQVVYAGDPQKWRRTDNPFRQGPFNVTNLPTLLKVTSDGQWHKLVEADVYDQAKLDAFVDGN